MDLGTRLPAFSVEIIDYISKNGSPYKIQYQAPGEEKITVDEVGEDRLTTMSEIAMQQVKSRQPHSLYNKILANFLDIIENNKTKFIEHNPNHQQEDSYTIFTTYWFLETTSSSIQPEHAKVTRHKEYTNLPIELKRLIN